MCKKLITIIFLIDVILDAQAPMRWNSCRRQSEGGSVVSSRSYANDINHPARPTARLSPIGSTTTMSVENFSIRQSSELFRAITSRSRPPTIHHRATFTKEKSRSAQWYPLIRSARRGSVAGSRSGRSNVRSIKTISARVPPMRDEEISRAEKNIELASSTYFSRVVTWI